MTISEYFIKKDDEECRLILRICQEYFKQKFQIEFDIERIISSSRKGDLIFQRSLICIYLYKRRMSCSDIARVLNKISHASVLNLMRYDRTQERDFRWDTISKQITAEPVKSELTAKIEWHQKQIIKLKQDIDNFPK